jgi:hypothetical protein
MPRRKTKRTWKQRRRELSSFIVGTAKKQGARYLRKKIKGS